MKSAIALIERRFYAALALTVASLTLLAWINRFVQDDAFIVFRYASHFARGQGLVYNLGERVEGYTSFSYALLVALGIRMGFDPVPVSWVIGLAAFVGSLIVSFRLVRRVTGDRLQGLAAVALLGLNYTFSAYATGGLETQLQTFFVIACLSLGADQLLDGRPRASRAWAWSTVAALAVLTRLDSALLLLPIGVSLIADLFVVRGGRGGATRGAALRAIALLAPAAIILGAWAAWKMGYYGDLLPNTFYAKAATPGPLTSGINYLYRFITSYWLEAPLLFALWHWRDVLAPERKLAIVMVATLAAWTGYVVAVGGDFMEFRFFVAVLPIVAWLLARTVVVLERRHRLGWPLASLILVGSLQHALVYNHTSHLDRIESVWHLKSHLVSEEQNWIGIGKTLGSAFGGDTSITIATTAAGAIPYYSDLRTIDMLGLSDRWIARHGLLGGPIPGHRRATTLDYLLERRVNLLIGHPNMVWDSTATPVEARDLSLPPYLAGGAGGHAHPRGLRVVEIPIDRGYRLRTIRLTPSASLDRAIRRHGWIVREVLN